MSARLSNVSVSRYRCFADELSLDLKPITLLYGWNNAGKSAALRLVGLLGDAVRSDAGPPFATEGPSARGGTFKDVEWRGAGDAEETGINFRLSWEGGTIVRASWRLDYSRESDEPYVRRLELETNRSGRHVIEAPAGLVPWRNGTAFTGLVPTGILSQPTHKEPLEQLAAQLADLRGGMQCLGINRGNLPREVPRELSSPSFVGPNGEGAVETLAREADIRAHVAEWYASREVQRELRVAESGRFRELVLGGSGATKLWDIPLRETGAGMSQVLPVLTAASLARRTAMASRNALVAVEEPESQLHGNAMRALVRWLCAIASCPSPPSLLLETHSHALLVAFQLAVANGKLPADRFRVYWLNQREDGASRAQSAELETDGQFKDDAPLPPNAFSDELELNDLYVDAVFPKA